MANITITDFEAQLEKLISWFRIKINPAHTKFLYSKLKTWPLRALAHATDICIETRKPTPGQWPTVQELRDIMNGWMNAHPREAFRRIQYDPVEDFRYPVKKLHQAMSVLRKSGAKAFERFCEDNRMPLKDRERVINKVWSAFPEAKEFVEQAINNIKSYDQRSKR